jgi:hypothetical protein
MANGDITYPNKGGADAVKAFASGKYTGLATANIDILCGFVPSKIKIWNETDGYGFEWFTGIAQGSMLQTVGSTGVKTLEAITGAPTPLAASASNVTGIGFRVPLGTTTVINTTADDCYWEAWR